MIENFTKCSDENHTGRSDENNTDCSDVLVRVYADIWSRYVSVFGGMWAASAFKGATGPCAVVTDIGYHVENHKQWMSVVSSDIRPLTDKFHGYALTGWQRFVAVMLSPRGQSGIEARILASASKIWHRSRRRSFGLGLGLKHLALTWP